ncbi:MAG: NAD-binding protein [Chloroflexi bacterium]|nr:NAD-binding protein [Chloroflexota bacterium]
MQILIYGCTRLTDALAPILVQDGHQVTVIDSDADRLAILEKQTTLSTVWVAEPLMQDYLMQGDLAGSEAFFSLANNDHENILLSQMASHIFNVPKVMCHLSDPQLQDFYQPLGISVLNGGPDSLSAARDFLEQ